MQKLQHERLLRGSCAERKLVNVVSAANLICSCAVLCAVLSDVVGGCQGQPVESSWV